VRTVDTASLVALIEAANHGRRLSHADGEQQGPALEAEAALEARFGCGDRLAVYGSLAPGRENHHVVAPLGGHWSAGFVEGDLASFGWGSTIGYPALRLRPGGSVVPVHVLVSRRLPAAWSELDAFEGAEYRRVLVPVWEDVAARHAVLTVANLYEAAATP
jgi:gamma-glutamylcyclotransferase (GGCT)/AIG2-like uncharacterized protein YtfP